MARLWRADRLRLAFGQMPTERANHVEQGEERRREKEKKLDLDDTRGKFCSLCIIFPPTLGNSLRADVSACGARDPINFGVIKAHWWWPMESARLRGHCPAERQKCHPLSLALGRPGRRQCERARERRSLPLSHSSTSCLGRGRDLRIVVAQQQSERAGARDRAHAPALPWCR